MPKALVKLRGKSLLQWSVNALQAAPSITEIVVALPAGVSAPAGTRGARGGAVRSESVREALAMAGGAVRFESEALRSADGDGGDDEVVLVHDAARPLITPALVEAVLAAVIAEPGVEAAIAATPISDTVKRVRDRRVIETLDRAELWAVQTPQAFRRAALERVLRAPREILAKATDDAALIEQAGGRVAIVPSSPENLKITTPLDLDVAATLLDRRGGLAANEVPRRPHASPAAAPSRGKPD
jgi:2-C-methyl-D-erythritol 4-phosphate cytidylyltransferase